MSSRDYAALLTRFESLSAEREQWARERQQLTSERAQLTSERAQLKTERDEYHKLYLRLLEQCRKLELGLLGQKAERISSNDSQLTLSLLSTLLGNCPSEPAQPVDAESDTPPAGDSKDPAKDERKKPTGRRPLPENLPRVEIELVPPEVERDGKDQYERIGEEVSETIERRRASIVVVRIVRGKWARKDRERNAETEILTAPALEQLPIDRGLAGPGMLADTIVCRFDDHLPANRLERIYERDGLNLSRSTICQWHFKLHLVVAPLLVAMWKDALTAPYLGTDATGVMVQAKDKCRIGHFWTVVVPERYILYAYSARHDSQAVDAILKGYKGHLLADAHVVYDHLYRTGEIIEVGCWAHCRRYYFKALESDPQRAHHALALINGLFRIERELANAPPGKRRATRKRQSQPLVEKFFAWCDAEALHVLDDTPIARAIRYARNQRVALQRFLEDPRLPIHNNASENALRRQAVGRGNWTFLGNDEGGQVNAAFVSLLATCRLHDVEPWAYLRDLLGLIQDWPASRVLELSPAHWKETQQKDETQQLLAANVFRRATLDMPVSHPGDE